MLKNSLYFRQRNVVCVVTPVHFSDFLLEIEFVTKAA